MDSVIEKPVTPFRNFIEEGGVNIPVGGVFIASEKFKEHQRTGKVAIFQLGVRFKRDFLCRVEPEIPPARLRHQKLLNDVASFEGLQSILKGSSVTLGQFWKLLEVEPGFLIAPCHGQFLAAYWRYDYEGWYVDAYPSNHRLLKLRAGYSVYTR